MKIHMKYGLECFQNDRDHIDEGGECIPAIRPIVVVQCLVFCWTFSMFFSLFCLVHPENTLQPMRARTHTRSHTEDIKGKITILKNGGEKKANQTVENGSGCYQREPLNFFFHIILERLFCLFKKKIPNDVIELL